MKKFVSVLLLSAVIFSFASCKNERAGELYLSAFENTLSLEYTKVSVTVDSSVRSGNSENPASTEIEFKKIRSSDGSFIYLSKSKVPITLEDSSSYALLTEYYSDGWIYQSVGNSLKMKHSLSSEDFESELISPELLFLPLSATSFDSSEISENDGEKSFEALLSAKDLSKGATDSLNGLISLYKETDFDSDKYSIGDISLKVTVNEDGYFSAYSLVFSISGKSGSSSVSEQLSISAKIIYPGSHFALAVPEDLDSYVEGTFDLGN